MKNKSPVLVFSCLALLLLIDASSAAEQASPQTSSTEAPEEIAVMGRRSLVRLKADVISLEDRTYNLFNQLNESREFDIICSEEIVKASRIPLRSCVPLYMRRARWTETQHLLFFDLVPPGGENSSGPPRNGGAITMNTLGAPMSEDQLWFQNNPKHVAFNENFRALAAEHPELSALALEWQEKQHRLAEAEAERKKGSAVGRFFAKFGKDEQD
jgi:hypothetical protein